MSVTATRPTRAKRTRTKTTGAPAAPVGQDPAADAPQPDVHVAEPSGPVADPAVVPGEYAMLDMATIKVNPDNFRDDAKPVPGIVENLETDGPAGLLAPVVVIPDPEGGYLLLDGEQRYLSAQAAQSPTIQAIIRHDLTGKADQLITMLRTIHRSDPTGAQQARGIKQLVLTGLDVASIARRTGFDRDLVKAGVAASALDKKTTQKAHDQGLDLTQMAALATFVDDPGTTKKLMDAADSGPFAFDREARLAQKNRAARAKLATRREELNTAGVRLLDARPYGDPKAEPLDALTHKDDKRITVKAHGTCPGHAIFLNLDFRDEVSENVYCLDWRANGHIKIGGRKTGTMTDADKAERRMVIANNKLMDVANELRREWLAKTMFAAAVPPKGAMRFIAETMTGSSAFLAQWLGTKRGLAGLLDPSNRRRSEGYLPARASDARCIVVTLASIAAAHEDRLTRESWRYPSAEDARWLTFLVANGYQPGEVEQIIIDKVAARQRSALQVVTTASATADVSTQPATVEPAPGEPIPAAPQTVSGQNPHDEPTADAVPEAPAEDGPADPAQLDPAQTDPAQPDPAQTDLAQPDPAHADPEQPVAADDGTSEDGRALAVVGAVRSDGDDADSADHPDAGPLSEDTAAATDIGQVHHLDLPAAPPAGDVPVEFADVA